MTQQIKPPYQHSLDLHIHMQGLSIHHGWERDQHQQSADPGPQPRPGRLAASRQKRKLIRSAIITAKFIAPHLVSKRVFRRIEHCAHGTTNSAPANLCVVTCAVAINLRPFFRTLADQSFVEQPSGRVSASAFCTLVKLRKSTFLARCDLRC